jgi:hypothetical protein
MAPGSAPLFPEGSFVIGEVLKAAEPRPSPDSKTKDKILYAVGFADKMAERIAMDLQPLLKGIEATTKRTAPSAGGKTKQLDINFSTRNHGLALGISLKSVHIREEGGRYTHNMKRNEEELRIEASGYHRRQPYAVMVGVLFLPFDSCDDGKQNNPSSFGSWVRHLRPSTARTNPEDHEDLFEKLYVALYEPDGSDLRFFDVESDPPRNGRPRRTLSYSEFLEAVHHAYLRRNSAEFRWDDGTEDPLDVSDLEP